MVFLYHKGETISSEVLAENACTHPARVRRVMAKLKKAGLVETREGRTDGGYFYHKNVNVTLAEISEALDMRFCDFNWRSGDQEQACMISSGMSDYIDMLGQSLHAHCQAYMKAITIADVEKWLADRKQRQA